MWISPTLSMARDMLEEASPSRVDFGVSGHESRHCGGFRPCAGIEEIDLDIVLELARPGVGVGLAHRIDQHRVSGAVDGHIELQAEVESVEAGGGRLIGDRVGSRPTGALIPVQQFQLVVLDIFGRPHHFVIRKVDVTVRIGDGLQMGHRGAVLFDRRDGNAFPVVGIPCGIDIRIVEILTVAAGGQQQNRHCHQKQLPSCSLVAVSHDSR